VRIYDIGQEESVCFIVVISGVKLIQLSQLFQIISMRALPDKPTKSEYEHSDWVNTDKAGDQPGDYVNIEIAFAFQALPGKSTQKRAKNICLLFEFFLGLHDWLHILIP